ncbi:hypothetical protein R6Q59_025105 [Mikania micrantha]
MPEHDQLNILTGEKFPRNRMRICIHLISPNLVFIKVKQVRLKNGYSIAWGNNGERGKEF